MLKPSTLVDCGPISVEFYHDRDLGASLDTSIFFDDRSSDPINYFVTRQSQNEATRGSYSIFYKVYYTDYAMNYAVSPIPFTISIVAACNNPESLT